MKTKLYFFASFALFLTLLLLSSPTRADNLYSRNVNYSRDGTLDPPVRYGIEQLTQELRGKGVQLTAASGNAFSTLLIGTYNGSGQIRHLVDNGQLKLNKTHGSLSVNRINRNGKQVLVIAGYDSEGLMYALLDLADAVKHSQDAKDWPAPVPECSESPQNSMRHVRVLMHHKANEDWYRSKEFWDWYLGMLATNRFNGLNLVYSHQTSYMAPMYAWHVKLDKFPDIRPTDITEEERQHNLEILRYVSKTCHDRGIQLTIGIWQHMPWKRSYVGSREDQPWYVEGLDTSNVAEYSYLALRKLLDECPGIARIQLRTNDESGIHRDRQVKFYTESVIKAIKDSRTGVKLDLRTVSLQKPVLDAARKANLDVRTSIKFFGEFLGLPFTPQEVMTEGYSYNDDLKKPLTNPVYNEVWMLGSHRVLLWGSENYGRRFGRNASYGGTIGFESDGPLAQKGFRDPQSSAWRIFKNKDDEYYTYEIERYWAFFRSIGRFSYNPDTDHEVWMRPFRSRFGSSAEDMAQAYEQASQVIGLICASHVSNINMYVWPEISMGGIIPAYNEILGTDKGLFPSINQQVKDEMAGKNTGRQGAFGLAGRFESIADSIEIYLSRIDPRTVINQKELHTTVNDFEILSHLARYHAHRQREGYLYAKFLATNDGSLLIPARKECLAAIQEWKDLIKIADAQYYDKMKTAMAENGHWKDKTFLVELNLKIIDNAIARLDKFGVFDYGFDFGSQSDDTAAGIFYPQSIKNSYSFQQRFTGLNNKSFYDPQRGFGFTQCEGLTFTALPEQHMNNLTGVVPEPNSPPPVELLTSDFVESKEPFRFRVDLLPLDTYSFTFDFSDRTGDPHDHGPFNVSGVGRTWLYDVFRDISVPKGTEVIKTSVQKLRENWNPFWQFEISPAEKGADCILSALTVHRDVPNMAHAQPKKLSPGKAETLEVTISLPPREDDAGNVSASSKGRLASATLAYRLEQDQPFETVNLTTDDGIVYHAPLMLDPNREGTLQYYFQAVSNEGRASRLPEPSAKLYCYEVHVTRDNNPPVLEFVPVKKCIAGKAMTVEVKASDPSGIGSVRVRFRKMVQTLPYESIVLERKGDKFTGEIPGEAIADDYDFVYYFEAVDSVGNGAIYPDWGKENPYIIVQTLKDSNM